VFKKIVLSIIIVALVFSRFFYLDRFPIGMTHDEIEYILSAKTYFSSGVDLSNTPFPQSIFQTKTEGIISFLPALILSPFYGTVPLNQFTARLPYIIINLLTALVLYFLVKKLFQNKNFAIISSIIFLANPWSFYLSRTAVDTAFALLFYLLGIFFILDISKKKLFLSFLFFTLGFFSYGGAKLILIPIVLICLFYRFFLIKSFFRPKLAILFFLSILTVFSFYFIGNCFFPNSINQVRSQEILFLNQKLINPIVNTDRQASLENPFKNIFTNKITISLEIFSQKYFSAFSPDVLFISGDNRGTYRFGRHGLFFIIDFIFVFIGLINLFKKHPKKASFLGLLILISPLSTAINTVETSVINRSFLLLPLLVILSAFGILVTHEFLSKKINNIFSFLILFLIISISFANFFYFYFFRFPIIGQENYFFSQRLIANYIIRNNTSNIVVVNSEPRLIFLETVFYSPQNQKSVLKDFVKNQNYQINNTIFTSICPKTFDSKTTYIIGNSFTNCLPQKDNLRSINEEQFGGPLYFIKNDQLCSSFPSQPWLRFHLIKDYQIEKLDTSTFCQTWIKSI
jgi:hypothetical protein